MLLYLSGVKQLVQFLSLLNILCIHLILIAFAARNAIQLAAIGGETITVAHHQPVDLDVPTQEHCSETPNGTHRNVRPSCYPPIMVVADKCIQSPPTSKCETSPDMSEEKVGSNISSRYIHD
jgi:hypothetical protein